MSSDDNSNWIFGIVLGLLGSIAVNTGNNIQSLGLKSLQTEAGEDSSPVISMKKISKRLRKSKTTSVDRGDVDHTVEENQIKKGPQASTIWLIGTAIFFTGSLLNFASYAFAAQSMLASLESIQFVTNVLFGKFMLHARVTRAMLAGTCLTVAGTVIAVQFSSKQTLDLNVSEIKRLYLNPTHIVYQSLSLVALVGLHFFYRKLHKLNEEGCPVKHSDVIMPFIYSIWSALFGTQSLVQAKVLAELLSAHSKGEENIFKSWFTYITLLFWGMTVVVWLKRLNNALTKFDPLFIIPLLQCSFIFFAIISGGIFFKEFETFNASQWIGFWFGIFTMFSGLVLLTPRNKRSKDEELDQELLKIILASQQGSFSEFETSRNCTSMSQEDIIEIDEDMLSSSEEVLETIDLDHETSTRAQSTGFLKRVENVMRRPATLFSVNQRARILNDAMVTATFDKDRRMWRKQTIATILQKLKERPISSEGIGEEVMEMIRNVKSSLTTTTAGLRRKENRTSKS